jgi:CRP/FNR family cyclic AMP-dependent transcriptional regulator
MNLEECLRRQPALAELPHEDFRALVNACEEKEVPDGHAFIHQGERADAVYFILSGEVEISVNAPEEADFVLFRTMGSGEILGLVALVDGRPRSATCKARGKVRVASLLLDGAKLLMNSRAPISCAFQTALATQLARDARKLNEALVRAVQERLCS